MEERKRSVKYRKKSSKKPLMIAVILVLVAVAGFFGYNHIHKQKVQELLSAEGIYQGIMIDGEDVSGMSEEEALALLQDRYTDDIDGQVLTLRYDAETEETEAAENTENAKKLKWEIPFAEIGAGYDVEGAVKAAYEMGRTGTEEEKFDVGSDLLKNGINIEVAYTYDVALMDAKLNEVAEEFDCEAQDSTVTRKSGKFIITDEQDGLVMDKVKTLEAVAKVMDTRQSGEALIAAEVTKPKVTAEDNEHVTDLIGTYYTTFNNSDRNRNNNLIVGCNYINGTILAPGILCECGTGQSDSCRRLQNGRCLQQR